MKLFAGRGLTLLESQQWAGTLAAVFAFLACAVSGEMGDVMVGLFPAALLGAWLARGRLYGRAEWLWTAILAGGLVLLGSAVFSGQLDIVLGAARFAELLLIHRLWHRRTERDELLLLLLSLLLVCAGAALAAELTFGLAFIGYAVSGTWALALTHLRFEIEGGHGREGPGALLESRRIATPALLGGLAGLAMLALAGSALVFFALPRVTLGGLRRASRPSVMAGLGDQVDLARHGTIDDDPRVVLRVKLSPPPRGDPSNLAMHWRARALPRWTGRGWRSGDLGIMPATRLPSRPRSGRKPSILTVDFEAVAGFSDGVVLTPEGWPLSVEFHRPMSARGMPQRLYRNAEGDLFYQPVDVGDLHYVVTVDAAEPDLASLRGRGAKYPWWVGPMLEVPKEFNPRIRALAERLGGGKDPADAAEAISHWLSSSMRYTRELPGNVQDPISDFLFRRHAGHCELFSSTMVLMLRSLGIPARNVTGYFGGTRTDAGYYAVRAGDAHSWVEAYFPEVGFARFDPTPPADRGSTQDGAWARMVLLWDAVQQRWRALVVDYDLFTQARAMQRTLEALNTAGQRLAGKAGPARTLRGILVGMGVLLLAAVLAVRARRRRFGWGRRGGVSGPPLSGTQRRAVHLWRRGRAARRHAGGEVGQGTTPQEAARAARVPAAQELADAYGAARWGGAQLSAAQARGLLRDLSRALRS
ncbi:MAG TPA: transglutaminaseTgpA domain-containing protein [Myxococcales bacterium]|nr:transglutaminaseTgpA domain-containing protein [Myxococcales bacterium]